MKRVARGGRKQSSRTPTSSQKVHTAEDYAVWKDTYETATKALIDNGKGAKWQQFIVHLVDERGDGIRDYYIDLYTRDGNKWVELEQFAPEVHSLAFDAPRGEAYNPKMNMMLRLCGVAILVASIAGLATPLSAVGGQQVVTGEVIDLGCHLKSIKAGGKGSTSQNHAECALQCAKKGMPVGILTADDVYTIVGAMTADDNKALIKFVNKRVTATGTVKDKDGKKQITVTGIDFEKASR